MMPYLMILVVPALGVLLYVAEHSRRHALSPRGRRGSRISVLAVGLLLGLVGMGLAVSIISGLLVGQRESSLLTATLTFVAQVAACLLMLWTANCALRVYRLAPSEGGFADALHDEHTSEQLRISAAAVALVPLLMIVVFSLFFAVPMLCWGVAAWTTRRSRDAQLLWTLALAVKNELPLAEEIDAFAEPLGSRQKKAYYGLSSRLRDGRSLGEALEMSSRVLPRSVASELRMAEDAGTLPRVLTQTAAQYSASLSRAQVDSSLAVMLVYGWSMLAIELAIVSFVMYYIVPKFKVIFEDFGVALPPLTRSAITTADFFLGDSLVGLPLLGLPILAGMAAAIVYFLGWGNLNLPLLMRWFPRQDAPPLLRSLAHAVGASQPLDEVLDNMAHRHLRFDMQQRLLRIGRAVERGQSLGDPLSNEGLISSPEAAALAAAQRAGNLAWALQTLANSMEASTRHRIQYWLEIVKPALIVSIGLTVGWFVLALFLPLVQLITDIVDIV